MRQCTICVDKREHTECEQMVSKHRLMCTETRTQSEHNRNDNEQCKMWDLEGKRSNGIETNNMNELWTLESFSVWFQIGMVRACYITHFIHTYCYDTHCGCCCYCFCFCLSSFPRLFVCVRAAAQFSVICICCCCDCWWAAAYSCFYDNAWVSMFTRTLLHFSMLWNDKRVARGLFYSDK